jgi:hypothetical protein
MNHRCPIGIRLKNSFLFECCLPFLIIDSYAYTVVLDEGLQMLTICSCMHILLLWMKVHILLFWMKIINHSQAVHMDLMLIGSDRSMVRPQFHQAKKQKNGNF